MTRLSLSLLLLFPLAASAADPLPDGVELRLGGRLTHCVDHAAAISPDGKRIATHPQNEPVCVWDAASGQLLYTLERFSSPSLFTWTAEGKLRGLFQGNNSILLHEWADAKAGGATENSLKALRQPDRPTERRQHAGRTVLSPDGRRAVVVFGLDDKDKEVRVYSLRLGELCKLSEPDFALPLPSCEWAGFSAGGNTLLTVQRQPRRVTAYNLTAKKPDEPAWVLDLPPDEQKYIEKDGQTFAVQGKGSPSAVLSADGKRVVIEFPYGTFEVWDGPKAKMLHSWEVPWYSIPGNAERAMVAVSPDSKRVVISSREKTGLVGGVVYDLDTGKEVVKLVTGPNVSHGALKYSPDGKRLYRTYQVWDTETGKDITPGSGHRGRVRSVIVSGDGKTIITAGTDQTARGWDVKTGKELWRSDFPYPVWLRQVAPDLAVASEGWGFKLIDDPLITLSTGKRAALPGDMAKGTKGKAWHGETQSPLLAITPDGKTAVTLNREKPALEVWDWPAGKLRLTGKFDVPDKMRLDGMGAVAVIANGNELLGLSVYENIKPEQGSGPAFRGMMQLEKWDLTTGKRLGGTPFPQYHVPTLVTSGKTPLLIDEFAVVKDAITLKELTRLPEEWKKTFASRRLEDSVVSPDGDSLAALAGWDVDREIVWFDLKTGKERTKQNFSNRGNVGLVYLPDGRLVSLGESVFVWKAVK